MIPDWGIFRWIDATMALDEPCHPVVLETLGWLVEDNEDHIVIASEWCPEEDTYRHYTAIPKSLLLE